MHRIIHCAHVQWQAAPVGPLCLAHRLTPPPPSSFSMSPSTTEHCIHPLWERGWQGHSPFGLQGRADPCPRCHLQSLSSPAGCLDKHVWYHPPLQHQPFLKLQYTVRVQTPTEKHRSPPQGRSPNQLFQTKATNHLWCKQQTLVIDKPSFNDEVEVLQELSLEGPIQLICFLHSVCCVLDAGIEDNALQLQAGK